MLNYAVSCGSLPSNPVAAVKLLRNQNTVCPTSEKW